VAELPLILRVLAARNSGEFNVADVARDTEIPVRTLTPYLELLQTLYLTQHIPAWAINLAKRVVSKPKSSLLDTGLADRLVNVSTQGASPRANRDVAGGLLKGFVTGEICRQLTWSEENARLGHFRDQHAGEVDLVLETPDGRVAGIEVKSNAPPSAKDANGLAYLRDKLGKCFVAGLVLHTGYRRRLLRGPDRSRADGCSLDDLTSHGASNCTWSLAAGSFVLHWLPMTGLPLSGSVRSCVVVSAGGVDGGQVLVTPGDQRCGGLEEGAAHRRQFVADVRGHHRVNGSGEDPVALQAAQGDCQYPLADPVDAAFELGEPQWPLAEHRDDIERPLVRDEVEHLPGSAAGAGVDGAVCRCAHGFPVGMGGYHGGTGAQPGAFLWQQVVRSHNGS